MKKHYLKTVEDVIALKDTDTKIYNNGVGYYKFVNGILCYFVSDEDIYINETISLQGENIYILEEEPVQKVTASDIGKLFKFWDYDEENEYKIAILKGIVNNSNGETVYYDNIYGECCWKNCRRLTPSEVAEMTGYKVEEK